MAESSPAAVPQVAEQGSGDSPPETGETLPETGRTYIASQQPDIGIPDNNPAAQEPDIGPRAAVSRLIEGFNRLGIGAMTIEGTDVASEFSRYLYDAVKDCMEKNGLSYIASVPPAETMRSGGPQRETVSEGTIRGTFAQRGDTVEVNLHLVSDTNGERLRSARFTVPLAELTRRNIAIEPENMKDWQEWKERELAPALANSPDGQAIHIRTWFDSEDHTYRSPDRPAITMTVEADRDCYFKIMYIDIDKQMVMIYPNSNNKNNYLRANRPRTVLENVKINFGEPYGAETILVIASAGQFPNINTMTEPVEATAENIRAAIRGSNGVKSDTITILKPQTDRHQLIF